MGECSPIQLGVYANSTDDELGKLADELEQTTKNGETIDGMRVIVDKYGIYEYLKNVRQDICDEI